MVAISLQFLIAAIIVITAIKIEILNANAGSILPWTYFESMGGNQKWRQLPWTTKSRWIEVFGEPPPADESTMHEQIARARANNKLRDIVSTWGLAQYPLSFGLASSSIWFLLSTKSRRLQFPNASLLLIACAAFSIAVYRGYFTSLI